MGRTEGRAHAVSDNPLVVITPTEMLCTAHMEPFRVRWPEGIVIAQLMMFTRATERGDVAEAAGGDSHQLNRVIREFSPICCLLGDDAMAEVYAFSLDGGFEQAAAIMQLRWR